MKKMTCAVLVLGMLAFSVGCAANSIVGQAGQKTGRYSGDVGITGNGTHLTIQNGSTVPTLSIIGDNCTVTVENGAELGRIEFWGNGSTVSIPNDLVVWVSQVGTNSLVRRSPDKSPPAKARTAP
jgi:hypothetical protein